MTVNVAFYYLPRRHTFIFKLLPCRLILILILVLVLILILVLILVLVLVLVLILILILILIVVITRCATGDVQSEESISEGKT